MVFHIGQSNAVFGHWESAAIGVEFGYRKPTHPEILDVELEAADFNEKWARWDRDKAALFAELLAFKKPDEDVNEVTVAELLARMGQEASDWDRRFNDLKSSISSEDLKPVFRFIIDHIITVDGVINGNGKPVKMWSDLSFSGQTEIMGAMTPYEVTSLYGEIKRSVMLKVAEKKP